MSFLDTLLGKSPEQPEPTRRSFLQGMMAAACGACLPTVVKAVAPQLVLPTKTLVCYGPGMYTMPLTDIVIDAQINARLIAPHDSDMDLMRSIRDVGIMNPLVCATTTPGNKVILVAGFRRWHCMATLGPRWWGYMKVPVHVREYSHEQIRIHDLIESKPRQELSRGEEHQLLNKVYNDYVSQGMSDRDAVAKIANIIGRDRRSVRYRIRTDRPLKDYAEFRAQWQGAWIPESGNGRA